MEDLLNVTYVTFGGLVDLGKYRYVYFVVIFTLYILIICSNMTVIYLIWVHRSLHEPMYVFIAALLLNSVFFSTNVYPKLLLDLLSDRQVVSYSACLLQFHMYYSLGGSEFLLLAAMAYDRYVSICRPLRYRSVMSRTAVGVVLLLAWLLPSCHVAVATAVSAQEKLCGHILPGAFCNNAVYQLQCETSAHRAVRDMVVMVNMAVIPLIFILFSYTRILLICYRSSGVVRKKAARTCLPHLVVLIVFSCWCVYDVTIVQVESHLPKILSFMMSLQVVLYSPLLNPIIYGLKMKKISKRLTRLLWQNEPR